MIIKSMTCHDLCSQSTVSLLEATDQSVTEAIQCNHFRIRICSQDLGNSTCTIFTSPGKSPDQRRSEKGNLCSLCLFFNNLFQIKDLKKNEDHTGDLKMHLMMNIQRKVKLRVFLALSLYFTMVKLYTVMEFIYFISTPMIASKGK